MNSSSLRKYDTRSSGNLFLRVGGWMNKMLSIKLRYRCRTIILCNDFFHFFHDYSSSSCNVLLLNIAKVMPKLGKNKEQVLYTKSFSVLLEQKKIVNPVIMLFSMLFL